MAYYKTKLLEVSIIGMIEGGLYLLFQPKNVELFFFSWILICMYFLIHNIFIHEDKVLNPTHVMGCANNYINASGDIRKSYEGFSKNKGMMGQIKDSFNAVLLLYIIINIVIYSKVIA